VHYLTSGFGTDQGRFVYCYADFRFRRHLNFYIYVWSIILSILQIFLSMHCICLCSCMITDDSDSLLFSDRERSLTSKTYLK